MAWLLLDEQGHVLLTDGRATLLDDYDPVAVKQRVESRLRLAAGQWFADLLEGIPWDRFLFIGGQQLAELQQFLRGYLLETQGVASVERLELSPAGDGERGLLVEFDATTTGGVPVSGGASL